MKTKEKILPVASCVLMLIISAVNVLMYIAMPTQDMLIQAESVLIGIIVSIPIVIILDEKYLYQGSFHAYLSVVAILIIQLLFFSQKRFFYIGYLQIFTAYLLPFSTFFIVKVTTQNEHLTSGKAFLVMLLSMIPVALVFLQDNASATTIALVVVGLFFFILKRDGRLDVSWIEFIMSILLALILIATLYNMCGFYERIQIIFSRGKSSPYLGWFRRTLDNIFRSTPLIGNTKFSDNGQAIKKLLEYPNHKIVIIIAKYGWLMFSGVVSVYAAFIFSCFKMISKIKQSAFAHYTALILSLSITIQVVSNIISLLCLEWCHIDPVFCANYELNMINMMSFDAILSLYLKRDKPFVINKKIDKYKVDKERSSDQIIYLINDEGEQHVVEILDYFVYKNKFFVCLKEQHPEQIVLMEVENGEVNTLLSIDNIIFKTIEKQRMFEKALKRFKENNEKLYNSVKRGFN